MTGELVVHESNTETIVCTLEDEANMLKKYFAPTTGRRKEDYDRYMFRGPVQILARMRVKKY